MNEISWKTPEEIFRNQLEGQVKRGVYDREVEIVEIKGDDPAAMTYFVVRGVDERQSVPMRPVRNSGQTKAARG